MVPKLPVAAWLVSSLLIVPGWARAQTPGDAGKAADSSVAPSSSGDTTSPGDKPTSLDKSKPVPKAKKVDKPPFEVATFGGGCFWHVEAVFDRLKGVKTAISGYAGGTVAFPSYEMVHTGQTGHIEVVKVVYDPKIVSYEDLLKVFWANHDPTSIDRQGPDEGPQYRSVIFYHNEDQRKAALKSYQDLTDSRAYARPIVTQLLPLRAFYEAEGYHQDYYGGKPRGYSRARATAKRPGSSKTAKKGTAQPHKPQPRGTSKSASTQASHQPPSTGDDEPQTPTASPAQP